MFQYNIYTSVAVSALKNAVGDANAASDYLLEMRQEREARQSAQRVQTSIEEAVTIDKDDDGISSQLVAEPLFIVALLPLGFLEECAPLLFSFDEGLCFRLSVQVSLHPPDT